MLMMPRTASEAITEGVDNEEAFWHDVISNLQPPKYSTTNSRDVRQCKNCRKI